ncbi:MAG: hypothetical protein DRQ55_14170 [Planctomycetota bacterium]|nr:MAG: hypothetical protein DRQ55_14170 [Planctomycetota bacterium]
MMLSIRSLLRLLPVLSSVLGLGGALTAQSASSPQLQANFDPADITAGGCVAGWVDTFGAGSGTDGQLQDMLEHDDGSGPALYVSGFFTQAGSVSAQSVARWDGSEWSALGAGLDGIVHALAVYDDGLGGGPQLYAAGGFTMSGGTSMPRIARWDGTTWNAVGIGMNGPLQALTVHDGALYAGGSFNFAGGASANNIARWDGLDWSSLGGGTPNIVLALESFDDGGLFGPDLYVGGLWAAEPGFPHDNLARWNGAAWSSAGGGVTNVVWSLQTYDWGAGPHLMLGGNGGLAGTLAVPHNGIVAWDGAAWTTPLSPSTGGVQDMALGFLFGDPVLLMAGNILDNVAAWDGSVLTALGDLGPFVDCVTSFDVGFGPQTACGGPFDTDFSAYGLEHVAVWGGTDWAPLGGTGISSGVSALLGHDDGSGTALYVGGDFGFPGGGASHGFARWKDGAWDDMGGVLGQPILDMVAFNDGAGVNLYVCGRILPPGGSSFWDVARWDGSTWTQVGIPNGGSIVYDLFVHNDGSGSALYAGGTFSVMSGVAAPNLARYDGSSWSAVGGGPGGTVLSMTTYDDGSGSQLYAGGTFHSLTGDAGDYVARWDGASWSDLGGGPPLVSGHAVRALEVATLFGETHLYVGGTFSDVNGIPFTEALARFNGTGWSDLPFAGFSGTVHALDVDYDGVFYKLVVGGELEGIGLNNILNLTAWNGFGWEYYGGGVGDTVHALTVVDVDDGWGPLLVAGGDFTYQVNQPTDDSGVARFGGCWAGVDNWFDLGFALGGTFGDPLLTGSGSLAPLSVNDVNLSNAFPSAFSGLFLSFASTPIPFMGGTLVPNPWIDPPTFVTTSASGDIPLDFVMPDNVPPGTQLFVQWAIQDPGGPSGVALSNALRGDVP